MDVLTRRPAHRPAAGSVPRLHRPLRAAAGSAPRPHRLLARAVAGLVVAVASLALLPTPPAAAHAAGRPPHATLSAEGRTVVVQWTALPDDAAAVGVAVGLLEPVTVDAYLGRAPFDDIPSDEQVRELSRAPGLRDYLLEHVQVRQDGEPCPGEAEPARDFIHDGARLEFTCPRPVEQIDLRITMLHDQDSAYRTFGVDGTLQTTVHTAASPEHTWDFAGDRSGSAGDAPRARSVASALVGALVLATAGVVGSLRLRRRGQSPAPHQSPRRASPRHPQSPRRPRSRQGVGR